MKRFAYDLVILGAGSGGYAAARTARELGVSVALVDKGPLGGLCILRGCMPSKTLLASSDALYDMREAKELGIHVHGNGDSKQFIADVPYIIARKRELVRGFAEYRIEGILEFPLHEGEARFISPSELQVRGAEGDDIRIAGKKFVIATGSVVAPPALEGLAEAGYIDSDQVLELERIPKSLIVLGGGYVACELGQYFSRLGSKVTMIIRGSRLLSGADDDIGESLTQYFRDEGIEIIDRAHMIRVEKRKGNAPQKVLHLVVDGVDGEIEAEEIFYALGRVPDVAGLGLEAAEVDAHPITGITVDDTLRTSNDNIFAIGDVTGKYPLVHVAIYQGELAARNAVRGIGGRLLSSGIERAVYDLVKAYTVFCDPQVAVVGKTERDLQREDILYVRGSYDFAEHGKAMTLGKTKGFVKMMASPEDGKILGAAIVGPNASDLIHEIIVAMNYGATVQDFMRIPHLHPTLAEIWTYPAEECAEKIGERKAGDEQRELATSAAASAAQAAK
jgi:pyruvate/2-oxoglutarate dehydrogenase complex dihydrolipoamide dehydrogenase (E3) component